MGKSLLFFILFLGCSGISTAQSWVYHPFPGANTMWRVNSGGYECCCADGQYAISGDTLISGNVYHKIISESVAYYNYPGLGGYCTSIVQHSYPNSFAGSFREDTLNKKIYWRYPAVVSDTLVYDFSLAVGDTLPVSLINDTVSRSPLILNWVSAIDSILIDGVYHKQFWISADTSGSAVLGLNYASIIEGIGSTMGLFGEKLIPPFESTTTLTCVSHNGILIYPDGAVIPCDVLSVGLNGQSVYTNFMVSPNPSDGHFRIELNETNAPVIEISDVLGNLISRRKSTSEVEMFDVSEQPKGIYFIRVSDSKGNVAVKKIVKQ